MESTDSQPATRRHQGGLSSCGIHPLKCASQDCINLLLKLCFDRGEIAALLKDIQQDIETDYVVVGALYRSLTRLVQENSDAAELVDAELRERLGTRVALLEHTCMRELARVWNQVRDDVDGISASALLWVVARSKPSCWRRLESVMVEDLHYRSARSFTNATTQDCPQGALLPGLSVR